MRLNNLARVAYPFSEVGETRPTFTVQLFSYGTNPRPTAIDARPLTIRSLIDPVPLDDLEPT